MANKLFTTKSIDRLMRESSGEHDGEHTLKRTLGKANLVMLGIGAIIGAGIFVLTGAAASQHAGPAVVISFVVAGLACTFAGLCYSEFASMIPIAGSAYTYAYATLGEFIAWIIGWDLILEYLFGASTVAVGWSGYMTSFLKDVGIIIPDALCNAPIFYDVATQSYSATGAFLNLPAMAIVGIMTWLLVVGIRESANINNVIVVIKVIVILLFIILGWNYINPENWVPFIPENTGTFGEYGWSGVVRAAGIIFFAYIGFDAVSTAAQEAVNPQKDMPFGILGSLVVCTILYILVGLVMTGIVPYLQLNNPAPIAVAIDATGDGLAWLRPIIKIGALAGLSSVILVMLMGQPRIFFSMSKDGLLPKSFGKVHPKYKTPYKANLAILVIVGLFAAFIPGDIVGDMTSIGTLFAFILVCISVIVLRKTEPDMKREFKTPFVPLVPILGVVVCLAMIYGLGWTNWLRLIVWLAIGLVIYFLYGRKKSTLNNPEK